MTAVGLLIHAQATHNLKLFLEKGDITKSSTVNSANQIHLSIDNQRHVDQSSTLSKNGQSMPSLHNLQPPPLLQIHQSKPLLQNSHAVSVLKNKQLASLLQSNQSTHMLQKDNQSTQGLLKDSQHHILGLSPDAEGHIKTGHKPIFYPLKTFSAPSVNSNVLKSAAIAQSVPERNPTTENQVPVVQLSNNSSLQTNALNLQTNALQHQSTKYACDVPSSNVTILKLPAKHSLSQAQSKPSLTNDANKIKTFITLSEVSNPENLLISNKHYKVQTALTGKLSNLSSNSQLRSILENTHNSSSTSGETSACTLQQMLSNNQFNREPVENQLYLEPVETTIGNPSSVSATNQRISKSTDVRISETTLKQTIGDKNLQDDLKPSLMQDPLEYDNNLIIDEGNLTI